MPRMLDRPAVLEGPRWVAVELTPADAPALQAFYAENPLYSELAYGRPWSDDAAVQEFAERPPADWPQGPCRFWAVLERGSGHWLAYLGFVEELLAAHVWHMGFFLVATSEHGSGLARELDDAWAAHAAAHGARWLRLGVIVGNARAESFWTRQGWREVRRREGVVYGLRTHTLSVRVKPLGDATVDDYLARVPRDRPEFA